MGRRKQEPYERRRQQILEGALKVFSTKGFAQATNRDVAEAAGIQSPGLIYHYFKDRSDLLRAIVERYAPPMQLVLHAEEMMALPPAEALTRLGMAYLRMIEEPPLSAFLKLVISEALRDPEFARVFSEIGPLRVLRFLADYLQRQMDLGTLRRADPVLAARCFIGPLVMHLLGRHILHLPAADIDPATMVTTNVELFLQGLQNE
jgi:AcrR family transcriptional regulator